MTSRINLTDRALRNLAPAAAGQRYKLADAVVPGLIVRVTATGSKSWAIWKRWNGAPNPSARVLGHYPAMSLADARDKAREWLGAMERGIDPTAIVPAPTAVAVATFEAVAEDFIARHLRTKRTGARAAHQIRTELIPVWGPRPINSITPRDVRRLIAAIADRPAPAYARNQFQNISSLFNWAIARGHHDLEHSPCDRLSPSSLLGPKAVRERVLDDDEIRAVWRATPQLGHPYDPLVRLLLLTGARKTEAAGACWDEFDLERGVWTIPAERFKSNSVHRLPLTAGAVALISGLPRWSGPHVFTTTAGVKPVNGFSTAMRRLRSFAPIEPWSLHDLRRTVRTGLSALRVPEPVAEMVIGHAKKGLMRIYDQHRYADEMREALEAWEARLLGIVERDNG